MDNNNKTPINKSYLFNVWGLSILIGSVLFLFFLISSFIVKEPGELVPALMALALFAGVFSWPTLFLCYFFIRKLAEKGTPARSIRANIYTLALTGILVTALFFDPGIFEEPVALLGLTCYIAGLTISIFSLKITTTG